MKIATGPDNKLEIIITFDDKEGKEKAGISFTGLPRVIVNRKKSNKGSFAEGVRDIIMRELMEEFKL